MAYLLKKAASVTDIQKFKNDGNLGAWPRGQGTRIGRKCFGYKSRFCLHNERSRGDHLLFDLSRYHGTGRNMLFSWFSVQQVATQHTSSEVICKY